MRTRIKLNPDEELKHKESKSKGIMGQTDVNHYVIINKSNEIVGQVIHENNASLKGFQRVQNVTQTDKHGNIIVQEVW